MDAAGTTGRLSEALSETATIFLNNLEALSEPVAAVLGRASGLAPVVATTTQDVEAGLQRQVLNPAAFEPFLADRVRVPRLVERREDLLGLLFSRSGSTFRPHR